MGLRLKTDPSLKNFSIFNSYAPHRGYGKLYILKYWNEINNYIASIPNNHYKSNETAKTEIAKGRYMVKNEK